MSCSTISTLMPSRLRMSWIQNAMSSVSSTLSPDHLHHLAHAVGQVHDQVVAVGLQLEEVDHLLGRLAMGALPGAHRGEEQDLLQEARPSVGVAAQQQVLEHRGVLEQLDVLEGARDAPPGDLVRG